MKKSLLLSTALLVGVGAFAQSHRILNNKAYKLNKIPKLEATLPVNSGLQPKANNHNSVAVAPPYTRFSSARNAFGFAVAETNALTYNQDLNCVAFFQRMTQDWPGNAFTPPQNAATSTSISGYQAVKFTTDNGVTWDSVSYFNNTTNWARYPSGQIYNPAGNTTLGNAWFVGTGPCTGASSIWQSAFFASTQIPTGAMPRTLSTNDQQAHSTNLAGSIADNTYFSSYSTTQGGPAANRTIYSGGIKYSNTGATTPTGLYGVAIFKGVFNGTNGFTWTQDSSLINKWTVSGGDQDVSAPKIAFGPDGMTGYILTCGGDATATLPTAKQSYQPMVWKTIDGGVTWNRVNADYDWATNNPEIFGNLRPTVAQNITLPAFFDTWGGGIAVDANGKLHYVTATTPSYSTDPDSLGYGFAYPFGYQQYVCDDRPWVFDFMTDGNGTWTTAKVTDLFTPKLGRTTTADSNAADNIWSGQAAGEYFDYDNRLRISRSNDGTKIFYSWTDGDTNSVIPYIDGSTVLYNAYHTNDYPWIYYRGMDVNTGMFTPIHENTGANSNSGGYFFFYAPDIIPTTPGGYNLPMTYIDSRSGLYASTTAVDLYYIDDNDISSTEFTMSPYEACIIGIKEMAGTTVSNVSQNFPNPTDGTSIVKVSLNKAEDITLNITNSIGQVVATQTVKGTAGENQLTIDATSLNSGIYFYTVVSGNSKVTRKMSVTK
ncbi:MAG: endonuclease/exonuclease/phosphatase [Bacteroidetes bacterium]|jgi:hypothetical protein|nr:endonuclease/exonuclease/phosphatase [Bacteroidota bacterium]